MLRILLLSTILLLASTVANAESIYEDFFKRSSTDAERVVDDTYTVILIKNPSREMMSLGFFFRNTRTGKNLPTDILFRIRIESADTGRVYFESQELIAKGGIGNLEIPLPKEGTMYQLFLEFNTGNEPNTVYRPQAWTVWLPKTGTGFLERYPLSYSETWGLIGFVLVALAIFLFTIWRKGGKPLEITIFGKQ